MELMLREFYSLRELDEEGRPGRAKLEALDLKELVDILY
jgi:aldehyde:ferredoxin oxidoreductase